MDPLKLFRQNIIWLRKQNHLSQEEMAKKLNIKRSTYAYMEKHGFSSKMISECSKIIYEEFQITIDELYFKDLQSGESALNINKSEFETISSQLEFVLEELKEIKESIKK